MDIAARLQQLEEAVKEARSMPLSSSAILNRDEILEMIAGMRDALPEEIKQARWVVKDREELMTKAHREAEGLVSKARSEQSRMVAKESVVQEAQEEAERVLADAREQARQIRLEAEDYVDSKLAQFEAWMGRIQEAIGQSDAALAKTAAQITAAREKIRGDVHPAQALAPESVEEG